MLHWEYSVRTEKNTSAQKHIYHRHNLQQGETYPALASSHPVRCHLRLYTLLVTFRKHLVWKGLPGLVCMTACLYQSPLEMLAASHLPYWPRRAGSTAHIPCESFDVPSLWTACMRAPGDWRGCGDDNERGPHWTEDNLDAPDGAPRRDREREKWEVWNLSSLFVIYRRKQ